MNLRPSGYEPDELPGCSTPRQMFRRCLVLLKKRKREPVGERTSGRRKGLAFRRLSSAVFFRWRCFPFLAGLATTYSPVS